MVSSIVAVKSPYGSLQIHSVTRRPEQALLGGSRPQPLLVTAMHVLKAMRTNAMPDWQPATCEDYQWIVADPPLMGGKLAVRGTGLAVSLILSGCRPRLDRFLDFS